MTNELVVGQSGAATNAWPLRVRRNVSVPLLVKAYVYNYGFAAGSEEKSRHSNGL